jgi:uncharacterized protein (TIGR00297 family)
VLAVVTASIAIALGISLLARRARALTLSGTVAATAVGTLALLAGWKWGVLLIAYFASSSALSRFRSKEKDRRTAGIVEKGGARDAVQVIANGGILALAAAFAAFTPQHEHFWRALGAGALAASASDTWATEVGTLGGRAPRSILTFAPVPPGTSGGITLTGTIAAILGAAFIGLVAFCLAWGSRVALAALLGGVAGSTLDSLLGASLQSRRWCEHCRQATERAIHDCGTATHPVGGLAWFDNDVVNIACGAVGGLLALAITR